VAYLNLADCHLQTLGLPMSRMKEKWLHVDRVETLAGNGVVFARSSAWAGAPGAMEELYRAFGKGAVFVGTVAREARSSARSGRSRSPRPRTSWPSRKFPPVAGSLSGATVAPSRSRRDLKSRSCSWSTRRRRTASISATASSRSGRRRRFRGG
jgi:hypothetical protein